MKKALILFLISALLIPVFALAADDLGQKLSGRILLQVQENGEAWYVNPHNQKRYFMGRPQEAFDLMRSLGIGISNKDLNLFPVADVNLGNGQDNDNDGLSKEIEDSFSISDSNADTDQDGYNDKTEILNGYDPASAHGNKITSLDAARSNTGKIFLQVESHGEAWYVNPVDAKRYYLGRPADAFQLMRRLGLGINNADLSKIQTENLDENTDDSSAVEDGWHEVVDILNENVLLIDIDGDQQPVRIGGVHVFHPDALSYLEDALLGKKVKLIKDDSWENQDSQGNLVRDVQMPGTESYPEGSLAKKLVENSYGVINVFGPVSYIGDDYQIYLKEGAFSYFIKSLRIDKTINLGELEDASTWEVVDKGDYDSTFENYAVRDENGSIYAFDWDGEVQEGKIDLLSPCFKEDAGDEYYVCVIQPNYNIEKNGLEVRLWSDDDTEESEIVIRDY